MREYWPCLLFLLAIIGFVSKALYNYPVAIMALLGLYKVIKSPDMFRKDQTIKLLGFAFLCLWLPQLISLPDAVNLSHSSHTVFPYLRFLFAGIFIIDEIAKNEKRLKFIIASIFYIVFFWCVDATIQFVFGKNLLGYSYQPGHITGMFHPRNTISHICSILSSFCFLYIYLKIKTNKWLTINILLLFFIVLLSGRRAAWVMLALSSIGFFVYLYLTSANRKQLLKSTGIITSVVTLTLVATISFHEPTNDRFKTTMGLFSTDYESINEATAVRVPIWETAYSIIKSNYINGIGPRGFRHAYQAYSNPDNFWYEWTQTHPHLLFLEILTETGIIGIIGYLLIFYILFIALRKTNDSIYIYPLFIPVIVSLFPLNAHMAFYGSIWSSMIWLLISIFFACLKLSNNRN